MEQTRISKANLSFVSRSNITTAEMVAFLKEGAVFRHFGDILTGVYEGTDLNQRLVDGLTEITGEQRDSVRRKVKNWIQGKNTPKNRELLFQICFVLELEEYKADQLLARASDTAIHYRSPEELVYAFALRTKMDYQSAVELKQHVLEYYRKVLKEKQADVTPEAHREELMYTSQVRDIFGCVATREELFDFFSQHALDLSNLHETAYRKFHQLLEYLMNPEQSDAEKDKYTLEKIVDQYIRMCVPQVKNLKKFDKLQKYVKEYWPNQSSLSRMQTRKEEVSRKALLLLFLVTGEFDETPELYDEDDYFWIEDLEEDEDTLLEMRLQKMNLFLRDCGMNQLDPGSPFDLLLMYALKSGREEYADERMAEILEMMYSGLDDTIE